MAFGQDGQLNKWVAMNELRSGIRRSIELSALMNSKGAGYQLRFGAARRFMMMWHAYRDLLQVSSDRTQPLTSEESCDLTRDVSVIYINISGTTSASFTSILAGHSITSVGRCCTNMIQIA
jgi:hypothetical protein